MKNEMVGEAIAEVWANARGGPVQTIKLVINVLSEPSAGPCHH